MVGPWRVPRHGPTPRVPRSGIEGKSVTKRTSGDVIISGN